MALRIQLLSTLFSNFPVATATTATATTTTLFFSPRHITNTRISCTNGASDAALASELAARAGRINTQMIEAEEAMRKSRQLLFGELCEYMGLEQDEAQKRWAQMEEDEKWVLVKGFVSEWGAHFHPLSARSAKEMVEEYLIRQQQKGNPPPMSPPPPPSSSLLFPGLKRMIGFS